MPAVLIPVIAVAVLILVLILLIKAVYKTPAADEALIVTGWRAGKGDALFRVHIGGGSIVIPGFQRAQYIKLSSDQTSVRITGVWDTQKIPVDVEGSVVFKVGNDVQSITNAVSRFLDSQTQGRGEDRSKMHNLVTEVVTGHMRSIVGGMKIEDLIGNRGALAAQAREASAEEMSRMGLVIDSLQVQHVGDPSGFVQSLSERRNAEAQAEARIAKAQRDQEATLAEQEAQRAIAAAEKETAIAAAQYKAERDKAEQEAAQAGPLAQAEALKAVVQMDTERADLEAQLAERRLAIEVQKPAEAKARAAKTEAEGEAAAAVAQAEADAQAQKARGAAQAEVAKVNGLAQAEATRANGMAEADTAKAKGLAEAEALQKRAEALKEQSEAVVAQQIADKLPEVVAAAATAYSNVGQLTVFDGMNGINNNLLGIIASAGPLLNAAKGILGVDAKGEKVEAVTTEADKPKVDADWTPPSQR